MVDAPTWFANDSVVAGGPQTGVTYVEAIRAALEDELADDERVVILGEDIGHMGGAFRATDGLHARFGDARVIDTPMAESAMVGAAIGLAISGFRPIVELQFADFISVCYDQLVTEAAKLHYRFGLAVPIVVRAPSGGDVGAGPFHSQNPEGTFAHVPGLKVVCPGTVQDAYDLLRASVHDANPVVFFEHKALYRSLRGDLERRVPSGPLGAAAIVRPGSDVTVVSYGAMLRRCVEAADELTTDGLDVEVLDLRTVFPTDHAAIAESVSRTGRLVVVHEDTLSSGIGAEIAARMASDHFDELDAPIRRVTAPDTPVPFAKPLEDAFIPSVGRISNAIKETAAW